MDEPQVRAIFERLAGTEAPPSRVDIGLARLRGRRKLRLRRAVMSGTPAVAVAVLALSASGLVSVLPHGSHGPHRGGRPATVTPPPATRGFDPLLPYATFGWLPRGVSLIAGNTGRFSQSLAAGPNAHRATWSLTVFAEGRCNLSSAQVLRQLKDGGHPLLRCTTPDNGGGYTFSPQRQAPSVKGQLAFWVGHEILWEYTHASWATVDGGGIHGDPATAVKIAAGARFGAPVPALMFPIQLTGLPPAWRVGSVLFLADGVTRGTQLNLAVPGVRGIPQPLVDVTLTSHSCYFYPDGLSRHRTINGIRVVVTRLPARGGTVTFQVCAAHAHGLSLFVSTYGGERPRAVSIFRDHLRILGPDPSRWTANPLG